MGPTKRQLGAAKKSIAQSLQHAKRTFVKLWFDHAARIKVTKE